MRLFFLRSLLTYLGASPAKKLRADKSLSNRFNVNLGRSIVALLALCMGSTDASSDPEPSNTLRSATSNHIGDLYAHKINFDKRGFPMIAIRVASFKTHASIRWIGKQSIKGGLLATVNSVTRNIGKHISMNVSEHMPTTLRWRVELARFQPAEPLVEATRIKWQERLSLLEVSSQRPAPALNPSTMDGQIVTVKIAEVGALYGIGERTLDNRELLILSHPFATHDEAFAAAIYYQQKGWVSAVRLRPEQHQAGHITLNLRGKNNLQYLSSKPIRIRSQLGQMEINTDQHGWKLVDNDLLLAIDLDGSIAVIRQIAVDKLLAGIVPKEIYPNAPNSALQAQTIAARTDLLSKVGQRHLSSPYDVCNVSHCQNYALETRARSDHRRHHNYNRVLKAIQATRGRVMVDKHYSRLVPALYAAHCGGHSESNHLIWKGAPHPSLQGHFDGLAQHFKKRFPTGLSGPDELHRWLYQPTGAWCTKQPSKYNKWHRNIKTVNIIKNLLRMEDRQLSPPLKLTVLQRGVSGRITALKISDHAHHSVELASEFAVRQVFGGLPSAAFTWKTNGLGRWLLTGRGFGHGVGMCQVGAVNRAKAGQSATQILSAYYQQMHILTLY